MANNQPAAALVPSPFASLASTYREQGLAVVPCGPGTKVPGRFSAADGWWAAYDWQKYAERLPSNFELDIWERWPDAGVCLVLGRSSAPEGLQLVAVDIDTEEPAEVAAIRSVLPGSPVRKRGAKGETELYLAPMSVPNRPFNTGDKRRMLDLLCHGRQTVLPPTIHPTSAEPYRWTTLDTLENFDVADLPMLPADIADRLSTALAPFGHVDLPELAASDAEGNIEASTHRLLNEAALANLSAWVPKLGLYKCRSVGAKYKAVASWRPSSSGRPLSARATNLAISSDGIKDCGEGRGYTPLDLVMAATGADLDTAFRFLQEAVAPAAPVTLAVRTVEQASPPPAPATPPRAGNLAGLRLATFEGVPVQPDFQIDGLPGAAQVEVEEDEAASRAPTSVHPYDLLTPEQLMQLAISRQAGVPSQVENIVENAADHLTSASQPSDLPALESLCSPPGLVGQLIDWMEASSERPNRALLLGAALSFVSALAGRRYASPSNLRTNLYIVTLAPSGHGKDHAISQIKLLAEAAGLDRFVGPARIMSASALRKLVGREPSVACYMDEFGGFMTQIHDRRAGIHNSMIRNDLLELFSAAGTFFAGAEYAGEPATKVYSPNLSISGTSTPAQFWASLTSMSTVDGLLARMILINITAAKPERRKASIAPRHVPNELRSALHRLVDAGGRANLASVRAGSLEPRIVPLSEAAEIALEEFTAEIERMEATCLDEEQPFIARVREHAIKLALTVAVGENPEAPEISQATMNWGINLARFSMQTLLVESADRIADNERGEALNRILSYVKKAGTAGITEGKIADRMKGLDARMRAQILNDLQMAGRIRFERRLGTGGRASERYFPV